MKAFPLKIVTPEGVWFDDVAQMLVARTCSGDVGILAEHMDMVAVLDVGRVTIVSGDRHRNARCAGGLLSVSAGRVTVAVRRLQESLS